MRFLVFPSFLQFFLFTGTALENWLISYGIKRSESDGLEWITAFEVNGATQMKLVVAFFVVENLTMSKRRSITHERRNSSLVKILLSRGYIPINWKVDWMLVSVTTRRKAFPPNPGNCHRFTLVFFHLRVKNLKTTLSKGCVMCEHWGSTTEIPEFFRADTDVTHDCQELIARFSGMQFTCITKCFWKFVAVNHLEQRATMEPVGPPWKKRSLKWRWGNTNIGGTVFPLALIAQYLIN